MQKKVRRFRDKVKHYKEELEREGYPAATINSWIYTNRLPRYETAFHLSLILKISMAEMPYYKIERIT